MAYCKMIGNILYFHFHSQQILFDTHRNNPCNWSPKEFKLYSSFLAINITISENSKLLVADCIWRKKKCILKNT